MVANGVACISYPNLNGSSNGPAAMSEDVVAVQIGTPRPEPTNLDKWKNEILSSDGVRKFVAELMGTFLLVLIGCMGCLPGWGTGPPTPIQYSTSFGMVVMFVIQIIGHISGAHVNPAVTLASFISGYISLPMSLLYVIAQLIGASTGYGVLMLLTPPEAFGNATSFCVTIPSNYISVGQGVLVESIVTGVLILVCCAIWDPVNAHHDSVPLKFGFTIAAICMSAGHYTGASMNPARSFGPALWNNNWDRHWVYWVGPILGSALMGMMYHYLLRKEPVRVLREEIPLNDKHNKPVFNEINL